VSSQDRGAVVIGADGKPVVRPVVASFGISATATDSGPAKSLKFNFVQAPWSDVLKMFADAAGLTWDREKVPPGTFTYFDSKQYTPTEALNVLNGALLQKGYILVRRDRFAVVVNVDGGVPQNLVPTVSIADLPKRASNELVRVVMLLEGKDAAKAATEVSDMLGPQGKAVALSVANSLVVTGLAKNVAEIHAVLKSYIPEEEKDLTYEAFVLQNVSALSAEKMVRDLFGLQARGVQNVSAAAGSGGSSRGRSSRGGSDPRSRGGSSRESSSRDPRLGQTSGSSSASAGGNVSVTVDERTNMLLAMAPPTKMEVIRKAIETIDVPAGDRANPFAGVIEDNEPYLEVYKVNSADTMEVTKTLNVLFPGAVVNEDARFHTIHVMASKGEHEELQRMIHKLDGQGGVQTTAIIPIRQDPVSLTATLQALYAKDIENAPSVIANPGYLVVRGTKEQIVEIQQMVTQLDGAVGSAMLTGGGPIRTIPLGGRDAESLLRLLQTVTPNPIRVSRPSSGRGPIREQRVPSADDPRVKPGSGSDGTTGNFSVPPPKQAGDTPASDRTTRSEKSGKAAAPVADPASTESVDEVQRNVRLGRFVFQNLDKDKDGTLTRAEWSLSKRTRSLFESRKVSLELPADQAAFLKAFSLLADLTEDADAEARTAVESTRDEPVGVDSAGVDAELPEIVIEIRDGNIVLISDDEEALDKLEARLQSLMAHMSPKTTWTIFYLRSADATEAAMMLEKLFPQSSVSATASGSGGSLFGDLTGGISSLGSSLMDMTGINSLQSGPMALRIIPETRANALFVAGPADQVADVESVLKILDAAELPAQLRARAPRYITVEHADINEVAQIVRDVYKEELTSSGRSGGSNPSQGMNPLAMLMGGGGSSRGRSSRGGGSSSRQNSVKMTLGVDTRTSALVVSASDSLFKQVEALVATLDLAAKDARRTVRIVTLQSTNSSAIQQAVQALLPKTSVSTGGGSNAPTGFGPSSRSSSRGGSSAAGGDQADRIRQMMQMRQQMQGRGGSTGGRSSRGSSGGSSRGSSGRPSFGGGSSRGSSRGR
jgi:type II secretory pathway component GspD/PulD (secretin)